MRPTIHSPHFDLVEPIGIGTGLVEASSSLWKRGAERASVSFGNFARWAFDEQRAVVHYSHTITGQLALYRRFLGVDGPTDVAKVYLAPLSSIVASGRIEPCTLLPFAGLLSKRRLMRRYRAWCPLCLTSMLSGPAVYEPLLWRLRDVQVCPLHKVDLVTVCAACKVTQQDVMARFSRVGCCNRCGAWMGADSVDHALRRAEAFEVKVSAAIMSLLEKTAELESHEHDGRYTYRSLLATKRARDFFVSDIGISSSTVTKYMFVPQLPRLTILAAIACISRQPLHRVILGEITPWKGGGVSNSRTNITCGQSRINWRVIERRFEKLANGKKFINLKNACEYLNISMGSARTHFPDIVKKITERGRSLIHERKQEKLIIIREAFRMLIEAGEYPSCDKLKKLSGVKFGYMTGEVKEVIDQEWIRAEGSSNFRRMRKASRP